MKHQMAAIFLGGLCAVPSAVLAGDPFATEGQRKSVTPYVWTLSIDGDATVGPISTDVDVPFSDLLDKLNFGVMVEAEVWNGRWGVLGNLFYSDISDSNSGALAVAVDVSTTIIGGAVAYRFGPFEGGNNRSVFDAYAGLRYTKIDVELATIGPATAQRKVDFIDPLIGGRFITEVGPESRVVLAADIGGFGVGSDFSWQAAGLYALDVTLGQSPATLVVGYRGLGQDYTTGGTVPINIDTVFHGPVVGLSFTF